MALLPQEKNWHDKYKAILAGNGNIGEVYDHLRKMPKVGSAEFGGISNKAISSYFDTHLSGLYADPERKKDAQGKFFSMMRAMGGLQNDPSRNDVEGKFKLPEADALVKGRKDSVKAGLMKATSADGHAGALPEPPRFSIEDAVRGQRQPSIGEQQAEDIRKSGRMTAADQSAQDLDFGNQMYNKANPNAPVGSLAAREAALARIRPNVLQASGLYEYNTKNGGTNLASTSPDAMTPYSGQTNREVAYQKQFGLGGNWVGDNPLTGEVKIAGKSYSSQGAYEASQDTKGIKASEDEANDFANNAIADGLRLGKLREEQAAGFAAAKAGDLATDAAKKNKHLDSYLAAQLKAQQAGDRTLDYVGSAKYADPNFVHWTKSNRHLSSVGPEVMEDQTTTGGIGGQWGQDKSPLEMNGMLSLSQTSDLIRQRMANPKYGKTIDFPVQPYRVKKWDQETGGYNNGRWFSAGD